MKIRTQFLLNMLLFGLLSAVVGSSLIITHGRMERIEQRRGLAQAVERSARELSYLSSDYLLHPGNQQRSRWEAKLAEAALALAMLEPTSPEEQALVDSIRVSQARLGQVFASVAGAFDSAVQAGDVAERMALIELAWGRMEVQTQATVYNALLLVQEYRAQEDRLRGTSGLLGFVVAGVLGASLLSNYVLTFRRTLRSVVRLQAGTRVIGSGRLDHAIPVERDDEIGALSRAFNEMTGNLREVTASKAELEQEMAERRRAQEALGRSEAQLQAVFDGTEEGLVVSGLDGQLLYWNRAAMAMHGFASPDEGRRRLPELADTFTLATRDGGNLPVDEWPLARILRGETLHGWELQVRKQGVAEDRIWEYGGTLVRDAQGEALAALVTVRDVTERRRAEQAVQAAYGELEVANEELHEQQEALLASRKRLASANDELQCANEELEVANEELVTQQTELLRAQAALAEERRRYRDLFTSAPVAYLVTDAQGTVLDANHAAREMLGHGATAPSALRLGALVAADDLQCFNQVRKHLASAGGERDCELRLRPHGGAEERVVMCTAVAVRDEGSADEPRLRWVLRDVTERRQMEAQIASVARFPDENPAPVLRVSRDGTMLYANRTSDALLETWGAREGQMLPDPWRNTLAAASVEGTPRHLEAAVGETRYDLLLVPLPDQGYVNVYASDVTERRRAEEALRESEAKYRNLFENMTEEVHFWRLVRDEAGQIQTWRLVDANPPALATWGQAMEDIRGKTTDEIFGPGATEHYMPVVHRIFSEGAPHAYEDYFPHLDKHFRFASVPLGEYFITTGADITSIKKAQEAVIESEARLRDVLENSRDAIYRRNIQTGGYDYWSPAIETLTGYTVEEITALNPEGTAPLIHSEDQPIVQAHERALLESSEPSPVDAVEYRWRCKDGEYRWFSVSRRLVRDAEGRPLAHIGSVRDIHEQQIAQLVLAESEARMHRHLQDLAALYDASQALVGELEERQILQRTCEVAVARFGLRMAWVGLVGDGELRPRASAGEDDGYTDSLRIRLDDPRSARRPVRRALASSQPIIITDTGSDPVVDGEWQARMVGHDFHSMAAVPFAAGDGERGVLMLYAREPGSFDEEQMRALQSLANLAAAGLEKARLHEAVQHYAETLEEAVAERTTQLRESEARFRAVYNGAPIGVALVGLDGRLLDANPALEAMVGWDAAELAGRHVTQFLPPETREQILGEQGRRLLAEGASSARFEARYLRRDGQMRWARASVSPVRMEGEAVAFLVGMLEDVTDEREARQALLQSEKLNVTGQLAAAFAHEIKNPLQAVIGVLGLMAETQERSTLDRYLAVASEELHRADRILTRLRDLHRHADGDEPGPVALPDLLEQVLLVVEKRVMDQGVEVVRSFARGVPRANGMSDQLQQVFLNLMLNALDAMPTGGRLELVARPAKDPSRVTIQVRDTGCGIAPEALPRVFEFLYSTKEAGTGLGLFVCRDIVRQHGGDIAVESEEGVGTTFTVTLRSADGVA